MRVIEVLKEPLADQAFEKVTRVMCRRRLPPEKYLAAK